MKWKHLRSIRDKNQPRWFGGRHLSRVRSVCEAVRRRTGADAWVDVRWAQVCFGYQQDGDVRLPMACKLFKDRNRRTPDYLDPVLSVWNEDLIVYALQLARVDPAKKARWAAAHEKARLAEMENDKAAMVEDGMKEAMKLTERQYQRHTMGRHYRGRAAVNGMKKE